MERIKTLKYGVLAWAISIPLVAYAVTWANGRGEAPEEFKMAAFNLHLAVKEVCRPPGTSYGDSGSKHLSCQAMDIKANTPPGKLAALKRYGLCAKFHPKGYYGATGDHYHVVSCSTAGTQYAARRNHKARYAGIYKRNRHAVRMARANSGYKTYGRDDDSFGVF